MMDINRWDHHDGHEPKVQHSGHPADLDSDLPQAALRLCDTRHYGTSAAAPQSVFCALTMAANRPPIASSSWFVPDSITQPSSST